MDSYLIYKELFERIYKEDEMTINADMKEHTYFKVGGSADILLMPTSISQVSETVKVCKEKNIPFYIIGNGSNILVKDGGIRGVVIKLSSLNKITIRGNHIEAECGALLKDVSDEAFNNSLTGFEFACGIPGSIGGAVFMNAGAYNGEIKDIVEKSQAMDLDGNILTLSNEELELGYRTSKVMTSGLVVISATFKLEKGDKNQIKDRIDDLTTKREEKQPLEYPSAGSTFKRPQGYFAGKLIQDAGLKGFTIGGAAVSKKHSGFVINKGNATAKDILDVIDHVMQEVKKQFGVELCPEVRIIGED